MSQEHEDESNNGPEDRSNDSGSNGSGSMRHNRHRRPELFPRHTKKEGPIKWDGISFSEINCMNIDQIVEMLENKKSALVDSAIFDPGNHYGFVVTTAEVSEMFNDGSLAVDFRSLFYDFYTSAFKSPHCGKDRFLLQQDYIFSCIVKVKDKALVASLDENRDNVSEIFRIIDGIEYSIKLRNNDPIIAYGDSYNPALNPIQRYLDNNIDIARTPYFLRIRPVSFLSKRPDHRNASS